MKEYQYFTMVDTSGLIPLSNPLSRCYVKAGYRVVALSTYELFRSLVQVPLTRRDSY